MLNTQSYAKTRKLDILLNVCFYDKQLFPGRWLTSVALQGHLISIQEAAQRTRNDFLLCWSPGWFWRSRSQTFPHRGLRGDGKFQAELWVLALCRCIPFHLLLQRIPNWPDKYMQMNVNWCDEHWCYCCFTVLLYYFFKGT